MERTRGSRGHPAPEKLIWCDLTIDIIQGTMAFINVNSMTKGEVVAAMSSADNCHRYSRHYIEENPEVGRRWLVKNRPKIYFSIGRISACQSQTARRGDYTNKEEEEEDEEPTTSDDEFIVDDLVESDGDYEPSDESSDEDSEMSD